EQPSPVQGRHLPHAKEHKTCQQGRAKIKNSEPSQIDHEPVNTGKSSALTLGKPSSVDLDHAGSPKCLHVPVQAANHHEQRQKAEKQLRMKKRYPQQPMVALANFLRIRFIQ